VFITSDVPLGYTYENAARPMNKLVPWQYSNSELNFSFFSIELTGISSDELAITVFSPLQQWHFGIARNRECASQDRGRTGPA
jgi:hypothetical protein